MLADDLAVALEATEVRGLERLTGGASRETWRFDAMSPDGTREALILRRDPPGRPSAPGTMTHEAAAARACSAAGLRVPEVLLDQETPSPWDTAGIVMRRVEGETLARRILRDDAFAAARAALAHDCGQFLAGLHAIPVTAVPGLAAPDPLALCRENVELVGQATPTMELAFRWLAANRPPARPPVIVHGDFRLGNLVVDSSGLAAVLDWELLHVGNPVEDLGWVCTKAWRFGAALPVGGFATRDDLLAAYAEAGGAKVELDELRWWEVLNTLKWSVGCMGQGAAHLTGAVRSVELAAIGRRVCEQEWDLLLLLCPEVAARQRVRARRSTPGETGDPDGTADLVDPLELVNAAGGAGTGDLHGRPTLLELLEAVEEFLREEVMFGTTGRLSFMARVAANVVATVRREAALGPGQAEWRARELAAAGVASEDELAREIACGAFDRSEPEVHELLASGVAAKLVVANPKYLTYP